MRGLGQYNIFNWDGFGEEKKFMVLSCGDWYDYQSKQLMGSKVEVVIVEDGTKYASTNGETITNLFEKLTFKVVDKSIKIAPKSIVKPIGVKATIYGEYRNQLSIKCDDIKVLSQPQKQNVLQK